MILSIIIPVYNIDRYISQCINSLPFENKNFEIILVDDGSTDDSSNICDAYAQRFNFIHVFHKSNGGVSSARNLGLEKACGDYIYFVDGDDWVEGFGNLLSALSGHDLYGVNYDVVNSDGTVRRSHQPQCETIPVNDYAKHYERHSHALWAFIFRREIIEKLGLKFCEELKYAEDWVFVVGYLSQVDTIHNIHGFTYKYRVSREGSAMNQRYDARQVMLHFKAFDLINEIKPAASCTKYFYQEREQCFAYVLNMVTAHLSLLDKKEAQRDIRNRISWELIRSFTLKYKMKAILALGGVDFLKTLKQISSNL